MSPASSAPATGCRARRQIRHRRCRATKSPGRRLLVSRKATAFSRSITHRVTEGIVDVLEHVEIEAHAPLTGGHSDRLWSSDQLLDAIVEQAAVGQPRQRIVMRHMRDLRLGAPPLGNIDHSNQLGVAAVQAHAPAEQQDLNRAAVGAHVIPVLTRITNAVDAREFARMGPPIFGSTTIR